jgi:hypothetical protein
MVTMIGSIEKVTPQTLATSVGLPFFSSDPKRQDRGLGLVGNLEATPTCEMRFFTFPLSVKFLLFLLDYFQFT